MSFNTDNKSKAHRLIGGLLALLISCPVLAADEIRVMSLNIYGWKTMPQSASRYAAFVNSHQVDVLGIQEGVDDWQIEGMPTDYSRAEAIHQALGECWERKFQVFVNRCRSNELTRHERFDLPDGPNAVRTGEMAVIRSAVGEWRLVNIHWDHESAEARQASAPLTAAAAGQAQPVVVLGDFNTACASDPISELALLASLQTLVDGGIDCILVRGLVGSGEVLEAQPSDHPAVMARLQLPSS